MRVLVVNDRRSERELLLKALPQGAYHVEAVPDESLAISAMAREAPQVIVLAPPAKGGEAVVRRLRSFDASGQAYLITIVDSTASQRELAALLDAGANDFVRRPVFDAELLERVKAPPRLLRWMKCVAKPLAFDFSAPADLSRLEGWQNLGLTVAEDLGQMVGQPFSVVRGLPVAFGAELHCGTIPLALAEEQLEVRVSVAVDAAALEWLRAVVLCDPRASEALTDDLLRELANTAGGALKRCALGESVTLTTGIPFSERLATLPSQNAWTLASADASASVAVIGVIQSKENQRVLATELSEGMVIVHEVRNAGGLLLVPAGLRLTSSSAAKLAKVLGPKFYLEVAPAA